LRRSNVLKKSARIAFHLSGVCLLVSGVWSLPTKNSIAVRPKKVDYNRDVRPILAKCFTCHGHDSKAVMANLRLDQKDTATQKLANGGFAIVPFHPEKSEVVERINAKNALQMPPTYSNKVLSDEERKVLTDWIAQGAEYKSHWAFTAPVRPPVPTVSNAKWAKNPVDNFILQRLEEEGLKPAERADKRTLIRRVTLDLLGVPPKPADVEAFVKDKSPNAYEKVVDRLLGDKQYGERMAIDWLDTARYADSNGFQSDYERFQYRWRDWVIDAYNKNMPFDKFTVDQIAGDMIPNATLDQKIATGFNRNNRVNTEGGIIDEEWRIEMVIDRVETTSATWLGLTAGCCRCHDHKYDPLTQKDFYAMTSFFSNIPEQGFGVDAAVNQVPFIKAPYPDQAKRMESLISQLTDVRIHANACLQADKPKAAVWTESTAQPKPPIAVNPLVRYEFSPERINATSDRASQVEQPTMKGKYVAELGRSTGALVTGDQSYVDCGNLGDFDGTQAFSYALWINPKSPSGSPIARMDAGNGYRGWDLYMQGNRPAAHFINRYPENALKVVSKTDVPTGQWSHIAVSYDGSRKPEGIHMYINGRSVPFDVEVNSLKDTMRTKVPMQLGRRSMGDVYNGQIDDVVVFERAIKADEALALADVSPAMPFLRIAPEKRTPDQKLQLAELWSYQNDPIYRKLEDERKKLAREKDSLDDRIPTVSVMQEMPKPRDCYVLIRGQYDKHGKQVFADTPAFLPPIPKGYAKNRLGFAKWLVDPSNPLTSRVAVNRLWERFFGTGIVATSEDFGTRAEFPSHPELLDWLATEFIRTGWNVKGMVKMLVTSSTYCQSSEVRPESVAKDPVNRLLSRGPRYRLPAEVIRDQALAVSGLLVEKIGGRSVRPYQPEGIWNETAAFGNLVNYKRDMGEGLYRKSMYTIWKRTASPPEMTLFDVPSREICRVNRSRTDTPLQALVLLNDVTYVEAARFFGQRMIKEGGSTPESRVRFAFETLLSRPPTHDELAILAAGVQRRLKHYAVDKKAVDELLAQGDSKPDPKVNRAELAAYTITASAILNLDEALNKE